MSEQVFTREMLAHQQHGRAVERLRRLEGEMAATFNNLATAQDNLKRDAGVVADVEMSQAMEAAWVEYRAKLRNAEATPMSLKA